jgi:hypothetical protein
MGDMVGAVYGVFAGDSRSVERSVEHLTHGNAGDRTVVGPYGMLDIMRHSASRNSKRWHAWY